MGGQMQGNARNHLRKNKVNPLMAPSFPKLVSLLPQLVFNSNKVNNSQN